MRRSWLQPPRLRIGQDGENERHATWLELFYDLVFVTAIIQLSENLIRDISISGFIKFVVLFIPVWWSWIGAAFFATRFDTDDTAHRLLTMLQMIAVAAMAANVHAGLGSSSSGFAISYAIVRLLLVVEYIRAGHYVREARLLTGRYSKGFALAALIWLISAFVPIPTRFLLWAVGLVVDFGTPIFAGQLHSQLAPHAWHLPERFGLFTLIVLGETIAGAVFGVSGHGWNLYSALTAALGMCIAFGLWGLYFDSVAGTAILAAREGGRIAIYQVWIYAHLPLTIGLVAVGVGVTKAVLCAPGLLTPPARWLLLVSAAICFLSLAAIHLTTTWPVSRPSKDVGVASRGFAALFMLVIALSGVILRPVALSGVILVFCAALVIIDFYEMQRH